MKNSDYHSIMFFGWAILAQTYINGDQSVYKFLWALAFINAGLGVFFAFVHQFNKG